jgi:hypothetical protein
MSISGTVSGMQPCNFTRARWLMKVEKATTFWSAPIVGAMSSIADKKKFVSGHSGTSVLEIVWITFVPVLLLASGRILLSVWSPAGRNRRLMEFALLVLPQVLGLMGVVTPGRLALILFILSAFLLGIAQRAASKRKTSSETHTLDMR